MTPAARDRAITLAMAACLVALSLAMYTPWAPRPFDSLDFSEFLPFLQHGTGFVSRAAALSGYYLHEHGRLNLLSYAALALKWTLLGPSPVLWQWARYVELTTLVAGCWLLFRRLTLGSVAALGAASLFVAGRVAGEAWTRMTMGEPLGLLCTLGALHLAIGWRTAPHPARRAACAGALMVGAVLAKEMLVGMLPLVWLIGGAPAGADGPTAPVFDAGTRRWLFWTTVPAVGTFLIALVVAIGGGAGGFTSLYGSTHGWIGAFGALLLRPWFVQGQTPGWNALQLPGNTLFVALLIGGLALAWRRVERRAALTWYAFAALALSAALAVLYVPWPYFNLYYAMPFFLGTALLFGIAMDAVATRGRWGWLVALLAWMGVIVSAAPATAHVASYAIALQRVNGDLATLLPQLASADRIVVARRDLAPSAWIGTAPTLRRYAIVTGAATTLPPARDLTCAQVAELLHQGLGHSVVITYLHNCGAIPGAPTRIIQRYRYVRVGWSGAAVADDSVAADVVYLPTIRAAAPRP